MARQRITITPGPGSTVKYKVGANGLVPTIGLPVTVTGDFDVEIEDLDSFVKVNIQHVRGYSGLQQHWTYRDPSGSLKVGDAVQVPFGYDDTPALGTVVALGRGEYGGPAKDVSARLVTEAL